MATLRVPTMQDMRYHNAFGPFRMPMSGSWDEYPTYERWARRQAQGRPELNPGTVARGLGTANRQAGSAILDMLGIPHGNFAGGGPVGRPSSLPVPSPRPPEGIMEMLQGMVPGGPPPGVVPNRPGVAPAVTPAVSGGPALSGAGRFPPEAMQQAMALNPSQGPMQAELQQLAEKIATPFRPAFDPLFGSGVPHPMPSAAGPATGGMPPSPAPPFPHRFAWPIQGPTPPQGSSLMPNPNASASMFEQNPQTSIPAPAPPDLLARYRASQQFGQDDISPWTMDRAREATEGVQGRPDVMNRLAMQGQAIEDRQAAARRRIEPYAPSGASTWGETAQMGPNRGWTNDPAAQGAMTQNFIANAAAKEAAGDADWDARVADVNQRGAGLMEGYTPGPVGPKYTPQGPSESYARKLAERQAKVHQFASMRALGRKMRQGGPVQIPGMGGGGAGGYNPVAMMMMGRQMGIPPEAMNQMMELQQRGRQHGQLLASQERMQGAGLGSAERLGALNARAPLMAAQAQQDLARQAGETGKFAMSPEGQAAQERLAMFQGGLDPREFEGGLVGGIFAGLPHSVKTGLQQDIATNGWSDGTEQVLRAHGIPESQIRTWKGQVEPGKFGEPAYTSLDPTVLEETYMNAPWHAGLWPFPTILPLYRGAHRMLARPGEGPHMGWGWRKPKQNQ